MSQQTKLKKPVHWPTLNTVIMVETVLRKMEGSVISVAELKRKLPRQVNHITLMFILEYLDRSNKIAFGARGISWIHNEHPRLRKAMSEGFEL